MTKTILLAAALLAAIGAPAIAAEGNGNPFPLRTPGVSTTVADGAGAYGEDTGSEAYPEYAGQPGSGLTEQYAETAPDTGSEAPVQTANSLPVGAMPSAMYAQALPNGAAPLSGGMARYAAR